MTYDNEGRLDTWVAPNGTVASDYFLYDNSGQRVLQSASTTVGSTTTTSDTISFDGITDVTITGSTTSTTKYYSVGGQKVAMRQDGTFSYLMPDFLGSNSITLRADGSVQAVQLFSPFGSIRYSDGTMLSPFNFTGQRLDTQTGLLYYNSRYYDSLSGRFISADSVETNGGGYDAYAYVRGNPETATDPTGHYVAIGDPGVGQDGGGPPPNAGGGSNPNSGGSGSDSGGSGGVCPYEATCPGDNSTASGSSDYPASGYPASQNVVNHEKCGADCRDGIVIALMLLVNFVLPISIVADPEVVLAAAADAAAADAAAAAVGRTGESEQCFANHYKDLLPPGESGLKPNPGPIPTSLGRTDIDIQTSRSIVNVGSYGKFYNPDGSFNQVNYNKFFTAMDKYQVYAKGNGIGRIYFAYDTRWSNLPIPVKALENLARRGIGVIYFNSATP